MNKYQKKLQQKADIISNFVTFELKINRRNGYYAVDVYRDTKYTECIICGNYKEIDKYLEGMRDMIIIERNGELPF